MKPALIFSPILVLVGTVAALGTVLSPATAQSINPNTSADPTQGMGRPNTSSDLLSGEDGGISSMMDLIHRANMGEIQSSGEFQQEQRDRIQSQAERFRERQQQLLQQRQQAAPSTPATPPPGTTAQP